MFGLRYFILRYLCREQPNIILPYDKVRQVFFFWLHFPAAFVEAFKQAFAKEKSLY